MLPEPPVVGLPVHPLGFAWARLRHVRAPAEFLPYPLGPAKGAAHTVLPLAFVDQIVSTATQEIPPRPVQDRCPPAAPGSRTYEPGPLSAEVAGRPLEGHGLPHVFPLAPLCAPPAVAQDHPLGPQ